MSKIDLTWEEVDDLIHIIMHTKSAVIKLKMVMRSSYHYRIKNNEYAKITKQLDEYESKLREVIKSHADEDD